LKLLVLTQLPLMFFLLQEAVVVDLEMVVAEQEVWLCKML
jgi:hypothetical protein